MDGWVKRKVTVKLLELATGWCVCVLLEFR